MSAKVYPEVTRGCRLSICLFVLFVFALSLHQGARSVTAQTRSGEETEAFGPVVSAYLGYLRNEQEVVDDRVSRREISRTYYRRNSNRIRALREIAIRIAKETGNDYLPELEAVAADELGTLFEHPPNIATVPVGTVLNNTFRFLGPSRSGEVFYVFARLDPYEQSELKRKAAAPEGKPSGVEGPHDIRSRPRRVSPK